MKTESAFSLIEILVSLLVVSLVAANISGLQRLVIEQNRENTVHVTVIELALEKMEEVLKLDDISDLEKLHGTEESVTKGYANFNYSWKVLDNIANAGEDIRTVELTINWKDVKGDEQSFTYAEQMNLNLLLNDGTAGSTSDTAGIIISLLETNDVIYFDPKMGYKKGAFVIYDSDLFVATSVHSIGNGSPRHNEVPAESDSGWFNYGRIDNPELANNPDLATLFAE